MPARRVFLALLLAAGAFAADRASRVESMLAERMRHYKVPSVSIAVIHTFAIDWARGYGMRTTPETLFQAASISKPVTAMAALHLVEHGRFGLEEDVNAKLIAWRVPENEFTRQKKVTVGELLSHSAGLNVHGFGGYAAGEPVPTLVQVLDGRKPANSPPIRVDTVPGAVSRYSGGGYVVLQQLMIDAAGKPFPDLMRMIALDRIGMRHSTFEQPLPKRLWSSAAVAYRADGQPIAGRWHTYPEMAAAGLWTTPSDLALFAIELQKSYAGKSNRVLSAAMTKQMLTQRIARSGLGIGVEGEGAHFRFSHAGGNEGYRCFLIAYASGDGAVIMTNSDAGGELIPEILRAIAAEYNWPDYRAK